MLASRHITFRSANNVLLVLIVIINLYVIAAPAWPQLSFWWQTNHTSHQSQLVHLVHRPSGKPLPGSQPNGLIIPAMLLNQPTLEGPESDWSNTLKAGIWRWPDSSTPEKGGNTVFLAHRFSYTGPHGAFYYLNKLKPGDEIGVIWNNRAYTYIVASMSEIPPTDTSIEDATNTPQITLFTCTPLWHPVNRLVVVAKLKGQL